MTLRGPTIRYTERIYKPGAEDFESFKEGDEVQTMQYNTSELDAAHDLWHSANAKVKARLFVERERLQRIQDSAKVDDNVAYSMEDIEEFFQKHGKGSHLLEYDFTPNTPEPVPYRNAEGKMSIYHCWTHKHTKYIVKRYASASGKGVDSGRLSKYLRRIKESVHPLAYARAKKILDLNETMLHEQSDEVAAVSVPLDRKGQLKQQVRHVLFFPFCFWFHFLNLAFSLSPPPL
jgi:hypothetical protein